MVREHLKNDKGYSLVELIIVIAIIVALAASALLSITMIHSARAKDGAVKLGSEINALKTRCMNMTPDNTAYDYYALAVYNDSNGVSHIQLVMHKKTAPGAGFAFQFDPVPGEDPINLSSVVKTTFAGKIIRNNATSSTPELLTSEYNPGPLNGSGATTPVIVAFDKKGYCYSGSGEFYFSKKNGSRVARVEIRPNGSINVR